MSRQHLTWLPALALGALLVNGLLPSAHAGDRTPRLYGCYGNEAIGAAIARSAARQRFAARAAAGERPGRD